jgi:serine phosphatase RsbU (regulator of sigma subunit)
LTAMHENLSTMIDAHNDGSAFVTGVLGRLDGETGMLSWTNAGHPLPLLIRDGAVVDELRCPPTPPWGTFPRTPIVETVSLEPGDRVLLYTDGVIDARDSRGTPFGFGRFVDLVGRSALDRLRPDESVRHLLGAVLEHRQSDLDDDATMLLLQWGNLPNS